MQETVLVCGGGTGGHLYPALAVLEGFYKRCTSPPALTPGPSPVLTGEGWPQAGVRAPRARQALPLQGKGLGLGSRFVYVGSRYGLEAKVVPNYPWIEFYALRLHGLTRPGQRPFWFFWALLTIAQIPWALTQTLYIILKTRPSVIIGMGGYASFPPLFWGALLRIPLLLHEQNSFPGLVNRLFARWAGSVCITYPESARYLHARRLIVTGLPLRPEILDARPDPARFGLQSHRQTVLIVGGSRGSQLLTETALAMREELSELQFLVVTGDRQGELNGRGAHTVLVPYIAEMGRALATADVVVARAGASTLAELAALHKPAVIVPWKDAAGGHQLANAQHLAHTEENFTVLPESELNPQRLSQAVRRSLQTLTPSPSPVGAYGRTPLQVILDEIEVLIYGQKT